MPTRSVATSSSRYQDALPASGSPVRRRLDVSPWRVPMGAPLGEAAYHVQVSFRCNPLQRLFPLHVEYPVMRFRIVEQAEAAAAAEREATRSGKPQKAPVVE